MSEDFGSIDKAQLISMIHFLEKRDEASKKENLELKELIKELQELLQTLSIQLQTSAFVHRTMVFLHT